MRKKPNTHARKKGKQKNCAQKKAKEKRHATAKKMQ